jgi:D-alanyl-D-alanine carboxypeptidase
VKGSDAAGDGRVAFRTGRSRVRIASAVKMSGNVRTGEWGIKLSQKASGLRGSGRVALGLVGVFAVTTIAVLPADAKHYRANVSTHEHDHSSSSSPPYAAIVVDGNSGNVLHSANADELRHPASLTKIMTLYLLFERLEAGKIKLDTQIPVSEHASAQAPTKLGLKAGNSIAVEDAIKGLVTKSANDAAVVIAEALGGSEGDFAEMMTRKAHALGMGHTVYRNASGLPNDEQVTTAREQALLGRAVQERFPRYYRYFSTSSFTYHGETMSNHNHLLGRVEGVDGIKTGYTQASGFNLVTSVHRNNRHIVAVVLGGSSAGARDAKMRSLIEEHIAHASTQHTAPMIAEGAVAMPVTRTAEAKTDTKVKTTVAEAAATRPSTQTAEAKTDVKVKTYEVASAPQQHWPASKFAAAAEEAESAPAPVRTKAAPTKPALAAADDTIKPIPVKTIKVKLAQTQTAGLSSVMGETSSTVDAAAPFRLLAGRPTAAASVAAAPADATPVNPTAAAPVAAVAAAPAAAAPIDPTPAAPAQAAPIAPTAATAKAAAPEEAAVIAPAQAAPAEPPVATPAKAPHKAPVAKTGGMMLAAATPPVLIAAPPVAEPVPTPAPVAAAPATEASIIAALTTRPAPAGAKPQAPAPAAAPVPTPVSAAPAATTVIAAAAPAAAPVPATPIAAAPATTTVIAAATSSAPQTPAAPMPAARPAKPPVVASMTQNTVPAETPAPEGPVAAAAVTETTPSFPAVQAYKPVASKPKAAATPAPVVAASAPDAKPVRAMRAGWVIQVGAFDVEHDAQQRLSKAHDKIGHVLDRADPFTEPVLKGEKTLYRARFAGFQQKDEAEAVCKQLKRNDIDCMTIKN